MLFEDLRLAVTDRYEPDELVLYGGITSAMLFDAFYDELMTDEEFREEFGLENDE